MGGTIAQSPVGRQALLPGHRYPHTTFANYAPGAREILNGLLERYAADGEPQFTLPDVLKVPPISSRGNDNEIMRKFGNATNLRSAVNQLQSLLYAA